MNTSNKTDKEFVDKYYHLSNRVPFFLTKYEKSKTNSLTGSYMGKQTPTPLPGPFFLIHLNNIDVIEA